MPSNSFILEVTGGRFIPHVFLLAQAESDHNAKHQELPFGRDSVQGVFSPRIRARRNLLARTRTCRRTRGILTCSPWLVRLPRLPLRRVVCCSSTRKFCISMRCPFT